MKIALVHDFLTQRGGAERVLRVLADQYPSADIYTLVYDRRRFGKTFQDRNIRSSFIQRMPGGVRFYQAFLPLMPAATERLNLSSYDLVISSASAFAKGVITSERSVHVCYCHTPTRYLWTDTESYLGTLPYPRIVKALIPPLLPRLRMWDQLAAMRPDVMLANSHEVQRRIAKFYRREAAIVYPPVELGSFHRPRTPGPAFLTGGRLVGYKRFDIVVQAFSRLRMPLMVFGDGPDRERLTRLAGPTVTFLGYISEDELAQRYAQCRAFIHPQEEDFGITVIEAMAAGAPVIAYGAGGALETVRVGETGQFIDEQSWEALADAVVRFQPGDYGERNIRAQAASFSVDRFVGSFHAVVTDALKQSEIADDYARGH